MKLGFIGLGIMGKPMVKNLLKAGYEVVVYDIIKENVDLMVEAGAAAAGSAKEVAKDCKTIITMLPNSPHVKAVVMGENGVLEGAQEGSVLIDMSSIAPLASKEISEACAKKGVKMIDAPVSGGEPKAIDATLSFMCGGEQEVFDQVKPILEKMGASVVLVGPVGSGNMTKLANQIIVAVNIAALSEALVLAAKSGVNPENVYKAIRGGLAGSTVMDAKAPMMLDRNFNPGFRIELHIKDLTNAMNASQAVDMELPMTEKVLEMMKILAEEGMGKCDHSAVLRYYEEQESVEVKR